MRPCRILESGGPAEAPSNVYDSNLYMELRPMFVGANHGQSKRLGCPLIRVHLKLSKHDGKFLLMLEILVWQLTR